MTDLNLILKKANQFMNEVARELGNPEDRGHAERVTMAVFHTLRDVITPEESMHLISQLPFYLKAAYAENWRVSREPKRIRSMEEFLEDLREHSNRTAARDFGNDETARQKTEAVFRVVRRYVSEGEIAHVKVQLPPPLLELWES
ncbi:DUF2267 domain-containing protein [Pontibacter korlensis]|uniref:DUF2267 domain-containing protein n=1 Tax=Pontibacter korlensis TaxID=400092 RepID=A0A0E3ZJ01_9BACT|nr:DUF2267 domain-containing protein [Pontibacter korlensis]AKD05344.1 hypothetical protein PKOR_22710 [Pontibacter korlensis]